MFLIADFRPERRQCKFVICLHSIYHNGNFSVLLACHYVPKEYESDVNVVDEKFGIKSNRFLSVDDSFPKPSSVKVL